MSKFIGADLYELGCSKITKSTLEAYQISGAKGPWLATIDGICPTYGLKRNFVNSKERIPFKQKGLYGNQVVWELEQGRIYQCGNVLASFETKETVNVYFGVINNMIYELEVSDIRKMLNMNSNTPMKTFADDQSKYADDNLEF